MIAPRYKRIRLQTKSARPKVNRHRRGFKKLTKKSKVNFNSRKALKRRRNIAKKARAVIKTPALPLNIDFHSVIDGVYTSYWVGKLISTLQREGKKKTAAKHFYKAMTVLKLMLCSSPLLLVLETLDKVRPNFRLRNRIGRRSIIKEYPILVLRPRQLILAVHWLKEDIQANAGILGTPLVSEIVGRLLDFKLNPKKNNLTKKRNEYIKRVIKAQFNIRYNFK